ncbi:Na(+)/H(+) antiporter subunit C [Pseudolysinimonas sp.]|jgi:multicomponent Na+:H+ antiporter subunit C|uniref:Na(+)/H(+) antiporter subunit C n=1 Tax=Pseudolysinimonas sp. TaxID=2680009 RepID=UPI0037837F9D
MTVSLTLVVIMAALFACGVYLLLERSMTRVLLGILMLGNAANLLILIVAGAPGAAPIVDGETEGPISDPLPQALALTAIVITFAVSAFLLALIYRSWRLAQADDVTDDDADRAVRTDRDGSEFASAPDLVADDSEFTEEPEESADSAAESEGRSS